MSQLGEIEPRNMNWFNLDIARQSRSATSTTASTFAVFVCTLLYSVLLLSPCCFMRPMDGCVASGARIADESSEGHEKGGACRRVTRQKITGVEIYKKYAPCIRAYYTIKEILDAKLSFDYWGYEPAITNLAY